jgi:hypothetical protein
MLWCSVTVALAAAVYAGRVRATPASGFTGTTIAKATFDEIDLKNHTLPADFWKLQLKTKGFTDMYVQSNTWQPHSTTGWHTHPGPSLIIITAGTVTAYEGDDPSCTPHQYVAGMSLVDPGDGHVHNVRNEDPIVTATGIAVQLVPAAATRRIDVPAPGNCPF